MKTKANSNPQPLKDDLLKMTNIVKEQKKIFQENFLNNLLKNEENPTTQSVDLTDILIPVREMIRNKDAKGLKLLFEKYKIKSLDDNERNSLKKELLENPDEDVLGLFIKKGIHIDENEYVDYLLESKNNDLTHVAIKNTNYFHLMLSKTYKTMCLKLLTKGEINPNFIEFFEILAQDKNGQRIIDYSWMDTQFKKDILIQAKHKNFKLLKNYKSKDYSWDGALEKFLVHDLPNIKTDGFISFMENCINIPDVSGELAHVFENFKIDQKDFYETINKEMKSIDPVDYQNITFSSGLRNNHHVQLFLCLGMYESLCLSHEPHFQPASISEFLLSQGSSFVSIFTKDSSSIKALEDALSHHPIVTMFISNSNFETLARVFSSVNCLDNWKDSTNNTLGHYLLVLGNTDENSKPQELLNNIKPLIEKYPHWFVDENNSGKSAKDIFKSLFGESCLPEFDMMVQNSYMKKNIKPKNAIPSKKLKKF